MPGKSNNNNTQQLFTVICRYNDGTYVEQLWADDVSAAITNWIQRVLHSKGSNPPIPVDEISVIEAQLIGEEATKIQDCVSAWVATAFPASGPVWLDIIKTLPE